MCFTSRHATASFTLAILMGGWCASTHVPSLSSSATSSLLCNTHCQAHASAVAQSIYHIVDSPTNMLRVEGHPRLVPSMISNTRVNHILAIVGPSLSVMSLHACHALQIPISRLCLTPLIQGFGYGVMEPYDNISLPATFGEVDDYLQSMWSSIS
jgi:hypothetical protein